MSKELEQQTPKSEQKTTQEQHEDLISGKDTVTKEQLTYSIFLAFAVLYPGADGETKNQLEKVFGFNEINNFEKCISYMIDNGNEKNREFQRYKDRVCKYNKILENTLWIDKKFTTTKEYEEITNKMKSTLNTANFSKQPEEERIRINKHVEEITQNLIQKIIPPGSIKNDTLMVITNSIFFPCSMVRRFLVNKKWN
ncbi:Serpin domain-containing protein [Entamoeba marina]